MKSIIHFLSRLLALFVSFYSPWSWELAWRSIKNLSMWLGMIALIAYFATLHFYLIAPSILFLGCGFSLIYKFQQGYRERRMRDGLYD